MMRLPGRLGPCTNEACNVSGVCAPGSPVMVIRSWLGTGASHYRLEEPTLAQLPHDGPDLLDGHAVLQGQAQRDEVDTYRLDRLRRWLAWVLGRMAVDRQSVGSRIEQAELAPEHDGIERPASR